MRNQLIALLLAVAMLLSSVLMAACAVPDEPDDETQRVTQKPGEGSQSEEATTPETHEPRPSDYLPSVNYNGADYTIMAGKVVSQNDPARDVVFFEDVASSAINEAVHDRNVYVEDKFGVNIVANWQLKDDMPLAISNGIAAGDVVCNVVECPYYSLANNLNNGQLEDLLSMSEYLDLSQPYWDQNSVEGLSLAHKLYMVCGDIMISDIMATWCVSFNRDMVNARDALTDPYVYVKTGEWTYDKMYEMASLVSDYTSHSPDDWFGTTWGVLSQSGNTFFMWLGCGNHLIVKDENDIPRLNTISESAYDAMVGVGKIQYDTNVTLFNNRITGVSDTYFEGTHKIFKEGHGLFFVGSMTMIEWMRAYDTDFGILPMPKANNEQVGYHTAVSETMSYSFAIPKYTDKDQSYRDYVGIITQALCAESTDTVMEAYYDVTLTYHGLRREEDVQMLDMVVDGRMFDLTLPFRWCDSLVQQITSAKSAKMVTRLKSMYDSYANGITKAISDYLSSIGISA